jgi:hypothetical protein
MVTYAHDLKPLVCGLRWKSSGVISTSVVASIWSRGTKLRPELATMTPHTIVGVTVLSDPYQFVEIDGDCTSGASL